MNKKTHHRLEVDQHLGDLLRHPAFEHFARLLLPWDNQKYEDELPLKEIGSLLPYHSHVEPETIVFALNRMIDNIDAGHTVFHEFYTRAQKGEVPDRANTGLFFYPGQPGAPFALIAPGGGFRYVASVHEGFPYAVEITNSGYNAFVLKYRHGHHGTPAIEDLAAAITYIFRNAEALGVGTRAYSLWGSSAGATMAAAIASDGPAQFGGDDLPGPSAAIMAYSNHEDVGASPPTFVVLGEDDAIAPPALMERRIDALTEAGATIEYRKYPGLGHGFGPGVGTSAEGWISEALEFWARAIECGETAHR
jgi:acetyl esterase/lipase